MSQCTSYHFGCLLQTHTGISFLNFTNLTDLWYFVIHLYGGMLNAQLICSALPQRSISATDIIYFGFALSLRKGSIFIKNKHILWIHQSNSSCRPAGKKINETPSLWNTPEFPQGTNPQSLTTTQRQRDGVFYLKSTATHSGKTN